MSLFEKRSTLENPSTPITADQLVAVLGLGSQTSAGIAVTPESGTRQVTAMACIRLIAETIGSLPIECYVLDGNARRKVAPPRWMSSPNPDYTWPELVEDMLTGPLTEGNSYTQLVRSDRGDLVELYPQDPKTCNPRRTGKDNKGPLVYDFNPAGGASSTWASGDIVHLKGYRRAGSIKGVGPIAHHRSAFGLAIAAEEFGSTFFGNGAHSSGVIEVPGKITKETAGVIVDTWMREHGGVRNANRPGVLPEGAKWQSISIPPEDAQFLETRSFQNGEIAKIYRVPPHLVGDVEKSTSWGTGIEEQGLNFVVYTLRTWIIRLENAFSALLPRGQFARINVDALLRGRTLDRYAAYAIARQWGWESANSILAQEGLAPIEGGDSYLSPLNMINATDTTSRPMKDRAQAASFLALAGFPPAVIAQVVGLFDGDDIDLGDPQSNLDLMKSKLLLDALLAEDPSDPAGDPPAVPAGSAS